MYATIDQVRNGVSAFVEREIATKAVGFQKFMTYMALPFVGDAVAKYANAFRENAMTAKLFNENGEVDIDELYNMAKSAVRKSGQFTVYGIILGETDIDKIYNYIKGGIL